MSFTLDYCCEQIEKHQDEVLVDQLRRLASESEGRFGSRGNTARLLRVVAARLEHEAAEVVAELLEMQQRANRAYDEYARGNYNERMEVEANTWGEATDLVAKKLVVKK
jgi:hypothetical protein